MLYHLLFPWSDSVGILNVFRYITFRTAGAVVTALVLSVVLGPWFIATLRRLSIGQNIREVGPESHLVKAGTPTMGGLLILFSLASATLLWADLSNMLIWLALGVTVAFGVIGFVDDFLKVRNKRNLGLTARAKF
ncbi:MAG: phospho-N-acetylmuramoyl-pentapeptide-transferase, partial [Acidobacteriota bacterium]